ncbi:Alpha/Beta hydrolase protein [Lineolata rhizophorae]|uniref:Carboxylic ester hydrolase n=1 Tax=Lineolata rhizophorae TaxID=578093 RepID=A0A6A6P6T2_9PEZI|nr:Alpha/Beta hydrolase protein [Lineolata rhizophorae]
MLPIVDLFYSIHQATYFNATGNFFFFQDIPYAAPPTGNLRFTAPMLPMADRFNVHTGFGGRKCPQAPVPAWSVASSFASQYLSGVPLGQIAIPELDTTPVTPGPQETEDCLYLDVMAPKDALQSAVGQPTAVFSPPKPGAPVLVWIHGGSYTTGSKDFYGDLSGLYPRLDVAGIEKMVFVSINYRLGAFGFLAGSTVQMGGVANAGLLDQRMALEWVRQNIFRFGGDPNRITVMGESAGAGSVMFQLAAYGGHFGTPFQQAIIQSPGYIDISTREAQDETFNTFLELAGADSLQSLRALPSEDLMRANSLQVNTKSIFAFPPFGPAVDGIFAPTMPDHGLLNSPPTFDTGIPVMASRVSFEGLLFTQPDAARYDDSLHDFMRQLLPGITESAIRYVTSTLYPADYGRAGELRYADPVQRAARILSEAGFDCAARDLGIALQGGAGLHAYEFAVPPALHAYDVPYTFWGGSEVDVPGPAGVNGTVANAIQMALASFVAEGRPRDMPAYGPERKCTRFSDEGITVGTDGAVDRRCGFWQSRAYREEWG